MATENLTFTQHIPFQNTFEIIVIFFHLVINYHWLLTIKATRLMCSLYIWIQILNLTYPNISMLVTMRQASNADRADNIILVEFPRI